MAADDDEEIDALFASDSDDDEFDPSAPAEEKAEQPAAESEPDDDDDDQQPAPAPRKALETAATRFKEVEEEPGDVGDGSSDDDGAIVREATPEVELGPPLDLAAPFVPRPATESLWLIRTSNIMHLEARPFDPVTFEKEEEAYEDEVTGEVKVRLRDESTIRWRIVPDGEGGQRYESNARFVRWSDGSRQLLLGDEVLDVAEQDVANDHHYLFVRHQGLIQGQAQLTKRMAVRPASLTSKAHRRLTAALDRRHTRVNRVQHTVTVLDPKKAKSDREKQEEARIRSREGLAQKQEKAMRKYAQPRPGSRGPTGLSAAYLEADLDDEEAEDYGDGDGLTATERARSALARPRRIDEAAEAKAERRLASAKREAPAPARPPSAKRSRAGVISSDEEGDLSDFIEKDMSDEEEEEERPKPKKASANRRHINISDSDDD